MPPAIAFELESQRRRREENTFDDNLRISSSSAASPTEAAAFSRTINCSSADCVMLKGATGAAAIAMKPPCDNNDDIHYSAAGSWFVQDDGDEAEDENLFIINPTKVINKQRQHANSYSEHQYLSSSARNLNATPAASHLNNSRHHHISNMKKQLSSPPLSSSLNGRAHHGLLHHFHDDDDADFDFDGEDYRGMQESTDAADAMQFYFNDDEDSYTDRYFDHGYQTERGSESNFDTLMLLYDDDSDASLLATRQESSLMSSPPAASGQHQPQPQQQAYLTIEELKVLRYSCWLCGCNWQEDHVSLDCLECGGYALTKPCPMCLGKCKQIWQRNLSATHDSHKASWVGQCSLQPSKCGFSSTTGDSTNYDSSSMDTTGAYDCEPPVTTAATSMTNRQQQQHAKTSAACTSSLSNGLGKVNLSARRSSSCCSSSPSSVGSSDSEL